MDRVINHLLTSSDFIKAAWNRSHTDLFETLISTKIYPEDFTQKPIAENLKLSQ
ncbi:SatD family protein, partial [Streptococcus suis]